MKPLKKLLLLPIACLALLVAAVATAEESLEHIRQQAELGDAVAQFTLGTSYYYDEGVKQDTNKAVHWYRKAAEQGYANAQFNFGSTYALGEGVTKDKSEAVRWYRKAAKQGHVKAQFGLNLLSFSRRIDKIK